MEGNSLTSNETRNMIAIIQEIADHCGYLFEVKWRQVAGVSDILLYLLSPHSNRSPGPLSLLRVGPHLAPGGAGDMGMPVLRCGVSGRILPMA